MLPVLSAEQIRAADSHAIVHEPIPSVDLMERAAGRCADWLLDRFPTGSCTGFLVLCGAGNNGGDGLAIARLLHQAGRQVRVVLCKYRSELSPDAQVNLDRLQEVSVPVVELVGGSELPAIAGDEVVVDALFGTGLDRPLAGWVKELVVELNRRNATVISIDLPSGLFCEDNASNDPTAIVMAADVLTFEVPKLALLLPENAAFVGRWHVFSIGLDRHFIRGLASDLAITELSDVAAMLPPRSRFAHKGSFGHALLIAGSSGRMGAALLAARACARSGVGLITAHVPAELELVMHTGVPEVMVSSDAASGTITGTPELGTFDVIGVGPGLGTARGTADMLKSLMQDARKPMVLDADAINILAENPEWLGSLPNTSILTPHPKEFDRLAGKCSSGYQRLQRAREFASRYGVVVVLKGAHTAVCAPTGKVFFNPTGNPGMAKGGSGDALTGIITGLLAQGLAPLQAAMLGVFAHGLAGDLAADALGMDGMLPSDLIDQLPLAWKRIREVA